MGNGWRKACDFACFTILPHDWVSKRIHWGWCFFTGNRMDFRANNLGTCFHVQTIRKHPIVPVIYLGALYRSITFTCVQKEGFQLLLLQLLTQSLSQASLPWKMLTMRIRNSQNPDFFTYMSFKTSVANKCTTYIRHAKQTLLPNQAVSSAKLKIINISALLQIA